MKITKEIVLGVSPERAFDVFTKNVAEWWPGHSHSVSANAGSTPKAIEIEPRVGGGFYETCSDGTRAQWGTVRKWQPCVCFETTWHPGQGSKSATLVRVDFLAHEGGCRVVLTHTGWEALGPRAQDVFGGYESGWDQVFGTCFAQAAARSAV